MIVTNKTKKRVAWYITVFKAVKPLLKNPFKPIPVKFPFKYFIITVLCTIIVWTIFASALIYRNAYKPHISMLADILQFNGRREKHKTSHAVKTFLRAPFNWIAANLAPEKIPHIHIDIKFKNYQKLVNKRERALISGALLPTSDDYVPGKIRFNGNTYKVKLRLKGDQIDHWGGDKWSFRINVKGRKNLFGFRRFSLQNPVTRSFESEIIFFEALRRVGVLTPRYFFVDLTVNGKYIGVMACQEHFSKELLESQGRKESIIFKIVEDNLSEVDTGGSVSQIEAFNSFRTNLVKPFRLQKILKSAELSKNLKTATGLFRGFANGSLVTSQVFDVDLMGAYMSVAAAWGAEHPIRWRNIRFYYNPITGLIEPIGYDANLDYLKRRNLDITSNYDTMGSDIMESDPGIKIVYEATLKKLKYEVESGITEKWVSLLQKKNLKILHKEYPLLGGISLFGMAKVIQAGLDRSENLFSRYRTILYAHLIEDKQESHIELVNPLPHPIIISKIESVNIQTGEKEKLDILSKPNFPFIILRTPLQNDPTSVKLHYKKIDAKHNKILVTANIAGDDKNWKIQALPYFSARTKEIIPLTTLPKVLKIHNYLHHDSGSNSLQIPKGEWIIKDSLVVPKGMTLIINKGAVLKFNPESSLIARGPVIIEGTERFPVILKGLDELDEKSTWQGISLLDSSKPSNWSHVKIFNTTGVRKDGWALSGGVNFYESDIEMDHVVLSGNKSEDALNVVRTKFDLKNITIKNTTSDAFDSDFSMGLVENGIFKNIGSLGGGDGIDASGSKIVVTKSNFNNISDKALSVGEESQLKISDVNIENVSIGVASKDGSKVTLSGATFSGIKKAGLMAYIKKTEYGPAEIVAKSLVFNSTDKKFITQKENRVVIDGVEAPTNDLDVKNLYSIEVKP